MFLFNLLRTHPWMLTQTWREILSDEFLVLLSLTGDGMLSEERASRLIFSVFFVSDQTRRRGPNDIASKANCCRIRHQKSASFYRNKRGERRATRKPLEFHTRHSARNHYTQGPSHELRVAGFPIASQAAYGREGNNVTGNAG